MLHETSLILTITAALAFAAVGGFLAARAGLPPIVGYILAGTAIGPFTPGLVADPEIAAQLAEVGVILLMFGVGIEFSLRDLLAVRHIAVPGALLQIAVATTVSAAGALLFGWPIGAGLVLGLALSVASTVVLVHALVQRGEIESAHGRIAVGWLVVEDIFIVVALVLLPALSGVLGGRGGLDPQGIGVALLIALAKVAALGLLMFFVGVRVLPWILAQAAHTRSRELFTLAVLALALGIATGSAAVFDVSLALGAFLAGAVLSESDLSHQAAAEALPLRDAFAVLFFVSVGMLFDPSFVVTSPLAVAGVLAIILVVKSLAALAIVISFGYPVRTAITVAVALAQIGEFSFILSALAGDLQLLPSEGHDLIIAGAILSIMLNALLFRAIDPIEGWLRKRRLAQRVIHGRAGALGRLAAQEEANPTGPRNHAILCGYGRVGAVIAQALGRRGFQLVVIDQDRRTVETLRRQGQEVLYGDAANRHILEHAGLAGAKVLIIAIPDAPTARLILDEARLHRPDLDVVARTHSEEEWKHLTDRGSAAVLGERELAVEMASHALRRFGVSAMEIVNLTRGLRLR